MPLHDWSRLDGWDGVHHLWLTELVHAIKPELPTGYRVYLGTTPALGVGTPAGKPDVAVRHWENGDPTGAPPAAAPGDPDWEVATLTIDPDLAIQVTFHGQLAAVIELISPRNKDRPSARATYTARYLGYLQWGVNLMLVDVHHNPAGFSFADALASDLAVTQPRLPAPSAVAYRVGGRAPDGGSFLASWCRPLTPGQPLPSLPLYLSDSLHVNVDLEATYARAAGAAYLT